MRKLYVVRDTATGHDLVHFDAIHQGEAFAKLASIVIATQRISFELHSIADFVMNDNCLEVHPHIRSYVCSASQAMLDSFFEDAEDVLDPKKDDENDKSGEQPA